MFNEYFTINDLPLTEEQKKSVLEWFARKLWIIQVEGIAQDGDYYGKHYDPLVIDTEEKIAHSYVFSLRGGYRHHEYKDLEHIEKMLMDEIVERCKNKIPYVKSEW